MVAANDLVYVNVVFDEIYGWSFEELSEKRLLSSDERNPLTVCYAQGLRSTLDRKVYAYTLRLRTRSEVGPLATCILIVRPRLSQEIGDFKPISSEAL